MLHTDYMLVLICIIVTWYCRYAAALAMCHSLADYDHPTGLEKGDQMHPAYTTVLSTSIPSFSYLYLLAIIGAQNI